MIYSCKASFCRIATRYTSVKRWEFVYFATRFVGISQNLSLSYSFYTTVVTNSLYEPHLLLKNISFPLRLSESQGMQKFKSQLNVINTCVINPCSVSEKDTLFQPIRARVIQILNYNGTLNSKCSHVQHKIYATLFFQGN